MSERGQSTGVEKGGKWQQKMQQLKGESGGVYAERMISIPVMHEAEH